MKFTVVWKPSAEQELAQIWELANDRRDVAKASHTIDRQLAESAELVGESREGNDRIYFETPIGIIYRVSISDRLVLVLSVWRTK